jgi:Do/DeqQ family serine protease
MNFRIFALCAAVICSVSITFAEAQPIPLRSGRDVPTLAPLVREITKAVVNIAVVSKQPMNLNPLFNDPFFRDFFNLPDRAEPEPRLSAGSGVIVDSKKGYVLTNNHVVENGIEISVTLTDRRQFAAQVIGVDPATDIALLQIDADNLSALPLGNSDELQVGDYVVAVGNPFGLGQTVTSGIVSALGRSGINPEGYEDFIQTDASINPGNSGGALVTLSGELIGINTAIIAPAGGNVGIGFAVPINMARSVMDQLIEYGEVHRGRLGVVVQDLTPDLAKALQIDVARGAIVSQVEPNSPAEEAGIKVGDVIVAVDGIPIGKSSDLRNRVGLMQPGRTLEITALRDGKQVELSATIRMPTTAQTRAAAAEPGFLEGAQLAELGPGMPGYGEATGIAVTSVKANSPAARAGLQSGDVITGVNNRAVQTLAELTAAMPKPGEGPTALTVYRDGRSMFLVVR